ncbi:MAG: SPOR domain-containing protein, partial [Vicingaceae bacterium]
MLRRLLLVFITILFSVTNVVYGQNDSIPEEEEEEVVYESLYGPTVGLGVGMFKFFGDILDDNHGNPLVSNIGYDLHVKQQLNPYLTAKFYVLFGTLSANERSVNRNLNFRSSITVGGFALMYNFNQFLKEDRIISPYVSLGIESVEFHSKTDLFDEHGNEYNYWSDGSIRDIAENSPNASQAVIIQRDYFYETDLRELNVDGFGKYPERTFAVPVGVGAKLHMTENIDFTVGTALHFTFSDYVDNISDESGGERIGTQPGNGGNDRFLMTSFSLSYNFLKHKKVEVIEEFEELPDYLAYDKDDEDGDGVVDFIDECPWTPKGVEVDAKGCPLDKDGDFVPNYKDDELESREFAAVTPAGVEMTDDMIFEAYQRYLDSTGMFVETERKVIAAEKGKNKNKRYKVQLGSFTEAIDAELVDKFLSIPDVEITAIGDTITVIVAGDYNSLPEAVQRKRKLSEEGFNAAVVVEQEKDGTFSSVGDEANNMDVSAYETESVNSQGLIFRVQLGAFSKRLSKKYVKGLNNIMEVRADDGLWKYMFGRSYKTIDGAAGGKIDLAIDYGVQDAFIVAYKDGKRISLKEARKIQAQGAEGASSSAIKKINKKDITFKVQVGTYKNQLPTDVLSKLMELESIGQTELEGGLTRYTAGEFKSFAEAEEYQKRIAEAGIGGAFVIAFDKEKLIPV